MKKKRIIVTITEELHDRLKNYAIKDDRTVNSVLRKVIESGINFLDVEIDKSLDLRSKILYAEHGYKKATK